MRSSPSSSRAPTPSWTRTRATWSRRWSRSAFMTPARPRRAHGTLLPPTAWATSSARNRARTARAAEIGIPAIIGEAGGCGLVTREAVAAHRHGLDQVLAHLGMTGADAARAG